MREFVVVSQRSTPLPAALKERLGRSELAGSLFRAEHATCLSLHGRHTIVAFRYLTRPARGVPGRFFDGMAVARGRLIQDESGLGPANPRAFAERARGVFSLVSVEPQRVSIASDPLSVYPLWYWQSGDLFVCSNNAHLIRTVLAEVGIQLQKDAGFFAWQLIFQNGVADSTGYEGVRWTPFGHCVTISSGEGGVDVAMEPLEASSVERLYRPDQPTDALIDQAQAEISENVIALSSGDFRMRVCDLSGGLDTRVMVAAVLGHGLEGKFGFNTAGTRSTPDGNVAALVRARYGLRHSVYVSSPQRDDPAFTTQLRSMLFRTYGCFGQLTSTGLGLRSDRRMLHLNGGCGETLRGPYSAGLAENTSALDSRINHVRAYGGLLRPEARDELSQTLSELFADAAQAGFIGADAADQHYIEHRNRQFMGTQCRARLNFQSLAFPLYSPAAIAAAFSGPPKRRGIAGVHFGLIDRLFPELLEIPLEGRTWDPDLYRGHPQEATLAQLDAVKPGDPDLAPSSYEDRLVPFERTSCAIPADPAPEPTAWERKMSAEGRHWTWVNLEASLGWLRETAAPPDGLDPIATVFDPAAVREFTARDLDSFTNSTDIRHVYRLQAALLWLGDQELAIPLEAT